MSASEPLIMNVDATDPSGQPVNMTLEVRVLSVTPSTAPPVGSGMLTGLVEFAKSPGGLVTIALGAVALARRKR
jgi:hypothetical protein